MTLVPEQFKYFTRLSVFYQDIKREEDDYLFVPALRRSLRSSTSARCAPLGSGDFTKDDVRGGFNGQSLNISVPVFARSEDPGAH
jgi:hypothetical protein